MSARWGAALGVVGLLGLVAGGLGACGDDGFHPAVPHLSHHPGGETLGELNLVTVTFPDDAQAELGATFDAWVLGSAWLPAVGGEYGVRAGAHLARVAMPDPAPASIDDAGIEHLVDQLIDSGAAPGPTHDGAPILYVLYFPRGAQITWQPQELLCGPTAWAYHGWSTAHHVPYAVVADCDGTVDGRTALASHEIIEAATDPFGTGLTVDPPDDDPWHYAPLEAADLCEYLHTATEDGYAVERSWSNAAAEAWDPEPCQPAVAAFPYHGVFALPDRVVDAAPGETVVLELHGWSAAPHPDWNLAAFQVGASPPYRLRLMLDAPTIGDGKVVDLLAEVPADAPSGQVAVVHVSSTQTYWPVAVRVR